MIGFMDAVFKELRGHSPKALTLSLELCSNFVTYLSVQTALREFVEHM
jgi:hypothetical protein